MGTWGVPAYTSRAHMGERAKYTNLLSISHFLSKSSQKQTIEYSERTYRFPQISILSNPKVPCEQIAESPIRTYKLPHFTSLEGHYALPSNQRHSLRQTVSRSQKIEITLVYIQLAEVLFKDVNEEFTVRVAKTKEEIMQLLEVGFEFVCEKDELIYFRKRK